MILILPPLYKRTTRGHTEMWQIDVVDSEDGTSTVTTTYGQVDGKMVVTRECFLAGKNIGKKNETTPGEQARLEATAKWNKKQERNHYGLDATGDVSAGKRAAAPMLAKAYKQIDKKTGLYVISPEARKVVWDEHVRAQPKLDGNRCLAQADGSLWSRAGVELTSGLPHVSNAIRKLKLDPTMTLDGELYQHGTPVTTISGWINGEKPEALDLLYHIYDAIMPEAPFSERSRFIDGLARLSKWGPPLVQVPTVTVETENQLFAFMAQCIEQGFEGAMLRWGSLSGYAAGARSSNLLKVKHFEDAEFLVTGVKEGKGTHAGMAVFQCVTDVGHSFDVTAPGTHSEKRAFFVHAAAYIGKSLKCKYVCYTATSTPVPFHVTAIGFRDDD